MKEQPEQENPPVFKTWKQWYALVIGNLVFLIILFYLFSQAYQ